MLMQPITLYSFLAFFCRYHYIGLILLFLHDIGDVLLESAKTAKYFEILDGKRLPMVDLLANVIFGAFAIEW